tara:strand:- start:167 stop:391 length:225 start_codon:yes stop_codon:yes gene_type:complete
MNKKELGRYHTNKKVRQKIDKLLEQNARNVSNFGTGSKYDLKTEEAYNAAWSDIESEIEGLDEKMFQIISKQND